MNYRASLVIPLLFVLVVSANEGQRREPLMPGRTEVQTRQSDVLELLSAPITVPAGESIVVGEFVNPGAAIVGLRVHMAGFSGDADACAVYARFQWRWGERGEFFRHTYNDLRLAPAEPGSMRDMSATYYVSREWGPQDGPLIALPQGTHGRVTVEHWGDCVPTVDSVQVWLTR